MTYKTIACLGPDAGLFLQGQLSCDIRKIMPDNLSLGAYCNPKGRVIALLYIYAVPEGYHLICPADIAETLIKGLGKVIVFSKATLRDISAETPAIATFVNPQFEIAPGMGFTMGKAEKPAPAEAWALHLIQLGLPTIGLAQSGLFLPHDIGLVKLGAVSFDKGCYVGQEIIARMHYKAKLKKQLFTFEGDCPPNAEVVNEVICNGKTYKLVILETGATCQ